GRAKHELGPLARDVQRHIFFPATQARVMLADVQLRLGGVDAAAATLRPWLDAARRDGQVGGALLAGPQVLDRLHAADWGGRLLPRERELFGRLSQTLRRARESAGVLDVASAGVAPPRVAHDRVDS